MQFISGELARLRRDDLMREAARRRVAKLGRPTEVAPWAGLERVRLFESLGRRDLARVARHADRFTRPQGATLTDEAHPLGQFIAITRGVAEARVDGARIGLVAPGDHVGELTLLGGRPQVPTVTALTDVEGFAFAPRDFWSMLHAVPAVASRLAALLADELGQRVRTNASAMTAVTAPPPTQPNQGEMRAARIAAAEAKTQSTTLART